MQKKTIILVLILTVWFSTIFSVKVKEFDEFSNPASIRFIGDRVYIVDGDVICRSR